MVTANLILQPPLTQGMISYFTKTPPSEGGLCRPPTLVFWKVKIHLDFIVLATIFTLANVIKTDIVARDFISQGKDLHLLDWASADLMVFVFGSVISTGSYEAEWVEDSLTLWKICFWDSFGQYGCLFLFTILFVFLFSGYYFDLHYAHCNKSLTLNGLNASRENEKKPTEGETCVVGFFLRRVGRDILEYLQQRTV